MIEPGRPDPVQPNGDAFWQLKEKKYDEIA